MTANEPETSSVYLLLIPLILSSQPDFCWLKKLKTSDQTHYWRSSRRQFFWIAKCWVARNTFQNDPLRPLLKEGRISRNEYNIIWSSEVVFERLWALCQHVEPFVQETFEQAKVEYPFDDALDLFAQFVAEMVDSAFALCLEPYVEHSRRKSEKALRLQAKSYAGEHLKTPQKMIVTAHYQGRKTPLGNLVLQIAQKTAKEEPIIGFALEDFNTASARLLKCYVTEVHCSKGYKWIDGSIVRS